MIGVQMRQNQRVNLSPFSQQIGGQFAAILARIDHHRARAILDDRRVCVAQRKLNIARQAVLCQQHRPHRRSQRQRADEHAPPGPQQHKARKQDQRQHNGHRQIPRRAGHANRSPGRLRGQVDAIRQPRRYPGQRPPQYRAQRRADRAHKQQHNVGGQQQRNQRAEQGIDQKPHQRYPVIMVDYRQRHAQAGAQRHAIGLRRSAQALASNAPRPLPHTVAQQNHPRHGGKGHLKPRRKELQRPHGQHHDKRRRQRRQRIHLSSHHAPQQQYRQQHGRAQDGGRHTHQQTVGQQQRQR